MHDDIVVSLEDPVIAVVRINRPKVHNALSAALIGELADMIDSFGNDPEIRAVIVTGTGEKCFSAGADIGELTGIDMSATTAMMEAGQAAFRRIEQSRIPVVVAVNGLALGGGLELVLACSFAVLSTNASLGLPEAGLGLIPGYGGTQRLARAVGSAVARYVMLTGRRLSAADGYRLGLTPVPPVQPADLIQTTFEMAHEISVRGPQACTSILNLVSRGMDLPLDEGLSMETNFAVRALGSSEAEAGITAFTQRQVPKFSGGR
jgi:enoyl-CoA hydratase